MGSQLAQPEIVIKPHFDLAADLVEKRGVDGLTMAALAESSWSITRALVATVVAFVVGSDDLHDLRRDVRRVTQDLQPERHVFVAERRIVISQAFDQLRIGQA